MRYNMWIVFFLEFTVDNLVWTRLNYLLPGVSDQNDIQIVPFIFAPFYVATIRIFPQAFFSFPSLRACVVSICPPTTQAPNNGYPGSCANSTTYPGSCQSFCNNPYINVTGSLSRTCQSNGVLSPLAGTCNLATCPGSNQAPQNGNPGNCNQTAVGGATCQVVCPFPYVTSGSTTRTCQGDGTWSAIQATCSYVKPPVGPPPRGGGGGKGPIPTLWL